MSIPDKLAAIHTALRRPVITGVAVMLILFTGPSVALADDDNGSCPGSAPATSGIDKPTGADASTYTYNSATGVWENATYTWNPSTKVSTPKTPFVFTCDTNTWQWTYQRWIYSPASKSFTQVPLSVTQLPTDAIISDQSVKQCAPGASAGKPIDNSPASTQSANQGSAGSVDKSVAVNNDGTVEVGNQIGSAAISGDATAGGNTTVGNIATGDSAAVSDVINTVQSSTTFDGGKVVGFTANINGDVQGDLIIDPSQIQPASDSKPLTAQDVTVHSQNSGAIDNNIQLKAASGNATASANTTAGNVSSGNAAAVANVINVLNSIVSAGKSFVGVININGNLNGNILVPKDFLSQLLATNAPHTTMTISAADAANLGISNTVAAHANTGSATATGNTIAGNSTSGTAATKVTIFNLTGAQLVGSNCMLVFVNVSGNWVGVIMNAPAGTTAAAIGDVTTKFNSDATVAAQTNNSIHNTIDVAAASGDATATTNTEVGNVKSGNADTAVNLLNLNNTQLNLSGWFGVLFINVFGDWFGNFGVYSPPTAVAHSSAPTTAANQPGQTVPEQSLRRPAFQFITQAHDAALTATDGTIHPAAMVSAQTVRPAMHILGAHVAAARSNVRPATASTNANLQIRIVGSVLMAAGVVTLIVERAVGARKRTVE